MKKPLPIIIALVVVIGLLLSVVKLFHLNAMSVYGIGIDGVKVEEGTIRIKGGFASSFPTCYDGYSADYEEGNLYIKIYGWNFPFFGEPCGLAAIDISIPNTYGEIKAVYLRSGSSEAPELIWPKERPVVTPRNLPIPIQESTTTRQKEDTGGGGSW